MDMDESERKIKYNCIITEQEEGCLKVFGYSSAAAGWVECKHGYIWHGR